jgi:hypothetical protein
LTQVNSGTAMVRDDKLPQFEEGAVQSRFQWIPESHHARLRERRIEELERQMRRAVRRHVLMRRLTFAGIVGFATGAVLTGIWLGALAEGF